MLAAAVTDRVSAWHRGGMCGRYAASKDSAELVTEFEVERTPDESLSPDYNVAPSKQVYVVVQRARRSDDRTHRELGIARWGLIPSWAKDPKIGSRLVNARVETAATKPSFRAAWARRRCLLPADGYYEWYEPEAPDAPRGRNGRPLKQPYFISPSDGSVLAMAGLYEFWRDPDGDPDDPGSWRWTTTVLTTEATDDLGRIHDRMPLHVHPEHRDAWLDPTFDQDRLPGLLVPAMPGELTAYPVSRSVNSVRNNGPELIEPLPIS